MLALRLDPPLLKALDHIVKIQHTNRSSLIRVAIIRYIEDFEDLELADVAKKQMKSTKPLTQLRKELGLDS